MTCRRHPPDHSSDRHMEASHWFAADSQSQCDMWHKSLCGRMRQCTSHPMFIPELSPFAFSDSGLALIAICIFACTVYSTLQYTAVCIADARLEIRDDPTLGYHRADDHSVVCWWYLSTSAYQSNQQTTLGHTLIDHH